MEILRNQQVIEDAKVSDALALAHLHARTWMATYRNDALGVTEQWLGQITKPRTSPEGVQRYAEFIAQALTNPSHTYLVARSGTELQGMLNAYRAGDVYKIEAVYVAPEAQGQGLGTRLMDEFVRRKDPSIPSELEVADYNEQAIGFYESYGFQKVPGSSGIFAGKIPTIQMRKEAEA